MPKRELNPTLSQRFKSLRYRFHPFYRRSGVFGPGHQIHHSASIPDVDARTLVSTAHRYLFVRVPKCANTTILTTLWLAENNYAPDDLEQFSDSERRQLLRKQSMKQRFLSPSQLTRKQANEVMDSYFKSIFVRNPYTRLASAYIYKIARRSPDRRIVPGSTVSLLSFCDFLADGGLHADIHWMPQTHISTIPTDTYDFVGRMESLNGDLDQLIQRLYGTPAPLLNRQHHATGADSRLRELYGPKEIQRVQELYAEDFEAFGYSTEPFWLEQTRQS